MRCHTYLIPIIGVCLLSACSTTDVSVYQQDKPILDMQQYFNGTIDAWGMFQDRSNKVVKRFTVVIQCHWINNVGTLDEDFTYADGSKQRRVWTLVKNTSGQYIGTAADVVGQAVGNVAGNALHWQYVLAIPVNGKVYNVHLDDWMYLMDDKVMLNRAVMSKFGFKLGEITLAFHKR